MSLLISQVAYHIEQAAKEYKLVRNPDTCVYKLDQLRASVGFQLSPESPKHQLFFRYPIASSPHTLNEVVYR